MNLKKNYEAPAITIQQVRLEQVIATSFTGGSGGTGTWEPLEPDESGGGGGGNAGTGTWEPLE